MDEKISSIFQSKIPTKCDDQGIFVILIKISNVRVKKVMFDLGASINIISSSIYKY